MSDELFYLGTTNDGGYVRPDPGKTWYLSKTIWVNVGGLIVFCATAFGFGNVEAAEVEAAVLAVVNVVLRWFTGEPLK